MARPPRAPGGGYLLYGARIIRTNPAGPTYPWVVEWPDGSVSDYPKLRDAVAGVESDHAPVCAWCGATDGITRDEYGTPLCRTCRGPETCPPR